MLQSLLVINKRTLQHSHNISHNREEKTITISSSGQPKCTSKHKYVAQTHGLLDGGLSCKADKTHRFTLIFLLYLHMSKTWQRLWPALWQENTVPFLPWSVTTHSYIHNRHSHINTHSGHRKVRYRPAASVIPPCHQGGHFRAIDMSFLNPQTGQG